MTESEKDTAVKSMRIKTGRGQRGVSKMRAANLGPILKIAGLVAAVAGLALLIIFVIVPLFGGGAKSPDDAATAEASATPKPTPTPIAKTDMSADAKELAIVHKSINDPYSCGDEVVFATGNELKTAPEIDRIAIYDMTTEKTTELEGITKKYASLFEPKMSENYIVYLDCKTENGGAVCGYDRKTQKSFVMREYLFGKPKVTLVGDYAVWLQQTGNNRDKLYFYHLPTQESVVIEGF